jgi:UDP-N-acetylglucosamine--N-acetylmuramyl-(pentapeptide) pyrophosphoryl-undecaprenol N-acetylglucosamine transferase
VGNRIIIAGGGTGGHIFPAIAIANTIKQLQPQTQFLFVGAIGKMEMEKVPQAGFDIRGIDIAGFNRSSLIKNIGLPFKLVKSFFQVKEIFSGFNPNAVIGVGGYSSFPVLKYAQRKGIKTFIHESNSFAGKANIWLGKNATQIFVASDGMEQFFPAEKIKITGNPVRNTISDSKIAKADALQFFGLKPNVKTVLSIGGSLGAKSINEAIASNIGDFAANNLQLIWQTGKPFAEEGKSIAGRYNNIWVSDFITKMEFAFAAADVVISRSGAMAIAELCIVKKPAVLVPYPHAAEDHQTANAQRLVHKQAALLVTNANANKELIKTVVDLCNNEQLKNLFSTNIAMLGNANADEIIASEIIKTLAV